MGATRLACRARPPAACDAHPSQRLTIVFDLDGTLVDTAPDLTAAANHVFGLVGCAGADRRAAPLHRPRLARHDRAGLRLHEVAPARGGDPSVCTSVPGLLRRQHRRRQPAFEGVLELLDALRGAARASRCAPTSSRGCRAAAGASRPRRRASTPSPAATPSPCASRPRDICTGTVEMAGGQRGARRHGRRQRGRYRHGGRGRVPSIARHFGYTPRPVRELGPRRGHRSLPRVHAGIAEGAGALVRSLKDLRLAGGDIPSPIAIGPLPDRDRVNAEH